MKPRRLPLFTLAVWCVYMIRTTESAVRPVGPSETPEAYFNGTSYLRLSRPLSLKQLVGLSFRTCVGGELFSQRFEGHTLHVTALLEQVVVSWSGPGGARGSVRLQRPTLDNRWHWVALRPVPAPPGPALVLQLDEQSQLVANRTTNEWLLTASGLETDGAVLLVGNLFSGCIHEGPQLEFHRLAATNVGNVVFGHCPLSTDVCKDGKDVLRIPPKDHCYNEPCLRHGTCISRHDRYECHCAARYGGNNCQVDKGSPCSPNPCRHTGRCVEDVRGDYTCLCPNNYHGTHCELEVSLDPQCVARPCLNNGSCSVPDPAGPYVCDCLPGFTGRNCETDVDECAGVMDACMHGGRCLDAANNYTCDCTGTGYTGPRCETNVDECAEERNVCGPGVCYDTYGGFVCVCLPGYTGERCQQVSSCASGPCGPYGTCTEETGGAGTGGASFSCVCSPGWTGPLCSTPATCADLVCPPHSHCQPGMSSVVAGTTLPKYVTCVCDPGFYGAAGLSPNCSSLETACEAGVCLNGGSCSRTDSTVNCSCAPGYKGLYCELSAGKALTSPERCAHQPCMHVAVCTDTASGFQCECTTGWTGVRCDTAASAVGAGEPCGPRACHNGATCRSVGELYTCECRPGYGGTYCELPLDCRATGCARLQECAETSAGSGVWVCTESVCAANPCYNGTCSSVDATHYRCTCPPGITGSNCETDIDECAVEPKICNHGVCVNVHSSYQCYCKPGYTGDNCEQDIDECLSAPCKNNGTCQNLENNYECTCIDGFEGKDCSVNIDECSESPCAAGSTCVDGVASYECVCQLGLTGRHCELDIDDCESRPCEHGGRCHDALNGYTCDCAGTGYSGDRCDLNIDECAPQPCRNGGTCRDLTNDYRCVCHPGYTGTDCELDINECESSPCQYGGTCLERSNVSLYAAGVFLEPFSYENASGYECVCVPGTTGARCELNIDECASSPCAHGKCVDDVGGYHCTCSAGFEGEHCEREIDECERYTPCDHGVCYDRRASYYCQCALGYGGRNCSVVLTGCSEQPCQHHGTCLPWLLDETQHRFNCSCAPGYYGTTCEKITTMSLEKSSYAEVNTSREEGYDISFRFKTTLGSGLLAMGRGLTYFFLELSSGRLNLHSSLLNKWEGVFIGSNLNDSNWQKVFVTINSSHLVLAANEEQTIYPISQNEAYNSSVTSFPSTRLGTAGSSYATLTHGPNFFVGCFQDVVVNGQWVLPGGSAAVTLGVLASCPRTPQCEPNPCRSGGACEDAWSSFSCACPRPHLGPTCQYNYTAATFGHESAATRSVVRVVASEAARLAVHAALDISMFVRTRKPHGQIFYLGGASSLTLVAASLRGGELLVQLRLNRTREDYTVGGARLDNGLRHLIQVVRNATLVQVKINGTEYFRKSISAARQLDAQLLYLGGPPPPPDTPADTSTITTTTVVSTATTTTTAAPELSDDDYFKGIIQDVQISNGVNVSVVQFFPLVEPGLALPPSFGEVTLDPRGVLPGVISDDACASRPCLHNATCTVTWNDYTCTCPRGYKGKQCAEVEFCQLQGCPLNSHCRNLDGGYECLSNATFDGVNTTLTYQLRSPAGQPSPAPDSLTITYRTASGGTLLSVWLPVANDEWWFSVGVYRAQVAVQWRLGGELPQSRRMRDPRAADLHHDWTTLRFSITPQQLRGAFVWDGHEEVGIAADIDTAVWRQLVTAGTLQLGGARSRDADTALFTTTTTSTVSTASNAVTLQVESINEWTTGGPDDWLADNSLGDHFKGCMGAVRVGSLLLPYFPEEELFVGTAAAVLRAQTHYALTSGRAWGAAAGLGCVLCLERECQHGGRCADVRHSYACSCPAGFDGEHCERDVDECLEHRCLNNATCLDGLADYTCQCPAGFTGRYCEEDVDECVAEPCEHGGRCTDLPGGFSCSCPAEWTGPTCGRSRRLACLHEPCAPGRAVCRDTPPDPPTGNNYTCECLEGFEGVHCESAFCELRACIHGDCLADQQPPQCSCPAGYRGSYCELEIDECAEGGAESCLHGGRCLDRLAGYLCDCAGTGWQGAHCELDVDECAEGRVNCGPGECLNHDGGYTCQCSSGFCGDYCALRDPCFPEVTAGAALNSSGPCLHGGRCEQRCSDRVHHVCRCAAGWQGADCSLPAAAAATESGPGSWAVVAAVCAAAGGAALVAGGGALLAAQARRKRATRGTYSPSGQEYCNPRAEHAHHALKPPPEERLI